MQPRFPRALANRANALVDLKRPEEATRDCLEALRTLPAWAWDPFWEVMAQACMALRDGWRVPDPDAEGGEKFDPDAEIIEALKSRNLVSLERSLAKVAPASGAEASAGAESTEAAVGGRVEPQLDDEGLSILPFAAKGQLREVGLL